MYIHVAPSSGHISLNCNMPFKLILRSFEVVFWCLEWECCTFWKIDGNSFKSTNTILHGFNPHNIHWTSIETSFLQSNTPARESPGKGVFFVKTNGYQLPKWGGGGVQVIGNEHIKYSWILWGGGGGGSQEQHPLKPWTGQVLINTSNHFDFDRYVSCGVL